MYYILMRFTPTIAYLQFYIFRKHSGRGNFSAGLRPFKGHMCFQICWL